VSGWVADAANVWVADLNAGANAGKFPKGITQVFAGDTRLPIGRWPNLDDTAFAGGWAHMDSGGGTTIQDSHLPSGNWTGAVVRVKTIRWLLLSRRVTGSSGNSLTLNDSIDCWGQCGDPDGSGAGYGWGYHLVNHRATLDQPGEWFFDRAKNRLYVVAPTAPTNIEASAIAADVENTDDLRSRGSINLGKDMQDPISWVVVENLRVMNHYLSGIAAPTNFHASDNHDLVIRCNTIVNPEEIGISLGSWVYECSGCTDDWYGGKNLVISNNVIDGPNRHGILTRAVDTVFQENTIRNVGQLANLGEKGLGCGFEGANCTEHGDGVLMTGASNVVFRRNRIEAAGYCGFDIFGSNILLDGNVIDRACSTKGDCGAIRTFGGDSMASTHTHDVTLRGNIIRDVVGPTAGDNSEFAELFGFGLYVDNNSRDVLSEGNVIARTTAAGILYQNSSGKITSNLVFDTKNAGREAVALSGTTSVSAFSKNSIVVISPDVVAIRSEAGLLTGSDSNIFFSPYNAKPISIGGDLTLEEWQAKSGQDKNSTAAWYSLAKGVAPNVELFVNDTGSAISQTLTGSYRDLRNQAVSSPVSIAAYSGVALVKQ